MKGLDWIAVDPAIADDPKVIGISHALKKDRYHIAGRFLAFLGNVARHAPDGNLSGFNYATLDSWAGDLRGFGREVCEKMCGSDGKLAAWAKFNGKKLTALQDKRDRTAAWREARRVAAQNQHSTGTLPEQNGNGTALTVTGTVTEKLKTKQPSFPASEAALKEHLPEACWPFLRIVIYRAQEGSTAVALSIYQRLGLDPKAIPNGPDGKFCTADEMAEVLKVVAGSKGTGWSERFVNGIITSIRRDGVAGEKRPKPTTSDDAVEAEAARLSAERKRWESPHAA